jgi:plastocyanin
MQIRISTRWSVIVRVLFLGVFVALPQVAQAQFEWHATVGAQDKSKGRQALAFLPGEMWIQEGDRIKYHFDADDIHTVTFLKVIPTAQTRPSFAAGCPGVSSSPASFNGTTCVTTPPMVTGQTFTVIFPSPGNFMLVCLVHPNMTALVHVLGSSTPLPHEQGFYDDQADAERKNLLMDKDHFHEAHQHPDRTVLAGIGEVMNTAGGSNTLSINRFIEEKKTIRAGETVDFDNLDPATPHTITFGTPPGNPAPPSANVTLDPDGARHVVLASPAVSAHSGFIVAAPQERTGLPQSPPGVTRFRVTFTSPGTYPYICVLHSGIGMVGTVVVKP